MNLGSWIEGRNNGEHTEFSVMQKNNSFYRKFCEFKVINVL